MNAQIMKIAGLMKRTIVIPAGIATLVFGGLFYLFVSGGIAALKNHNFLIQVFGLFGFFVAAGIPIALWRVFAEMRRVKTEINNTWFFTIIGLSLLFSGYAEYGPGGHYLISATSEFFMYVMRGINPALYDILILRPNEADIVSSITGIDIHELLAGGESLL